MKLVILIAALTMSLTAVGSDWPQFLGPNRDGASPETGLVEKIGGDGAIFSWRRKVGAGYAGPVVVGDRVFLFHFKDGQEVLEAFRAVDGSPIWSTGYPCDYDGGMFRETGPRATPTVVGDAVVSFGSDGVLQCLAVKDGAVRWRKRLQKEFEVPESFFGVSCSPLVHEGLVLVNLGARNGAGICAFQISDGSLAWKSTDDTASYSSPVVATLGGKPTALFLARSGLHGIEPKSGEERFFHRFRARIDASVNAATPLVWNDSIFLTSSYGVGAVLLDCRDAKPKVVWKTSDVLAAHFNTPVRVGDFLYGIDGRQEGGDARLVCLEWATGALKWSEPGVGCSSIIAADGKLFVMRESGELLLRRASPDKVEPLGQATIGKGLFRAAPALADRKIYVRSDSELISIDIGKRP